MRRIKISVDIAYDADAGVWVATSQDIRGLVVEAADLDSMRENILNAIRDLVELNGPPKVGIFSSVVNWLLGRGRGDVGLFLAIRDHEILRGNGVAC